MPVPFNELHDRSMVSISVADMAASGEGRHDDQRDARPNAEEIDRLHETGVIVTATFIKGNDECGLFRQFRMPLQAVQNAINQRFKNVELGTGRMSITKAVWFEIGNREQMAVLERIKEIHRILDVRRALHGVAHNGCGVLERVANIA